MHLACQPGTTHASGQNGADAHWSGSRKSGFSLRSGFRRNYSADSVETGPIKAGLQAPLVSLEWPKVRRLFDERERRRRLAEGVAGRD